MDRGAPSVAGLTDEDLQALRLGAQVMAHRAGPRRNPGAASYFTALEHALKEEISRRSNAPGQPAPELVVERPDGPEDRRLVAEYLGLLAANDRLSLAVRDVCRSLGARASR